MNTEQKQRIEQIQERLSTYLTGSVHVEIYREDVGLLLCYIKSQESGERCVPCGHDNYDAEKQECVQRWMEGRYSVVCGCSCAKHNSLQNAAESMRSRCVEKVREMMRERVKQSKPNHKDHEYDQAVAYVLSQVAEELQSLPLQEQK